MDAADNDPFEVIEAPEPDVVPGSVTSFTFVAADVVEEDED
jgi:hypothetical protein